jgi:hypothetical protein
VLTNKVDDGRVEPPFRFLLREGDVHDGTAREGSVDVCGSLLGRGAADSCAEARVDFKRAGRSFETDAKTFLIQPLCHRIE